MSPHRNDFHTQLEERADESWVRGAFIAVCTISLSLYNHEDCTAACQGLLRAVQRGSHLVHCQRKITLTGLGPDSYSISHQIHAAVNLVVEAFAKMVVGRVDPDALSQAHLGPRPSEFYLAHVSFSWPQCRSSLCVHNPTEPQSISCGSWR